MPAKGSAVEEVQGVGSTSAGAVSSMSAQGRNTAGNGGIVAGVGGRDSGHTRCAAWWIDAS